MGELIDYIRQSASVPFRWGKMDCLSFANECCRIQTGSGFADEFISGYSSAFGALKKYRQEQRRSERYSTIVDVADDRMERQETLHPRLGWIVAKPMKAAAPLGYSFGVVLDHVRLVFVAPDGLVTLPPDHDDLYWRPL